MFASPKWPGDQWESDQAGRDWVTGFRDSINLPAVFFDPEDKSELPIFRSKVREALLAQKARLIERQARLGIAGGIDFFDSAREALVRPRSVPFIGAGVYGDGPLGGPALIKALLKGEEPEPTGSLAEAAEYRERFLGERSDFLGPVNTTG